MEKITEHYELVVVGGGISGVLTAISSARHGVPTALVQNRPVLGGNASSEVRVNINGADRNANIKNVRESGLMMELAHRCKVMNPQNSFNLHDVMLWEMVTEEENLTLYLNTHIHEAKTEEGKIIEIQGIQSSTNKIIQLTADYFADTTGDADLAYFAGADYTIGREAKSTYNEDLAPDVADLHTMGSTIMFTTQDMGKPMPFTRPSWAYEMTEEKMGNRRINELNHGYWWVEVGGDELAVIENAEDIRDELMKYAFGVFDYIKNSGKYQADHLAIDWICSTPGRRESRRVYGDYMLNQNDLDNSVYFPDAIAYGGWTMDDHSVGGIRREIVEGERGSTWHEFKSGKQIYTIPYGCIYSRNISNLWVGGRGISASHMAMSSTRIIATCGIIGQAIGVAVSLAKKYKTDARGVAKYISELQQQLILDDCFIPGIKTEQKNEFIRNSPCKITASSQQNGFEADNICSDFPRPVGEDSHTWVSEEIQGEAPWVAVKFQENVDISSGILRFDPNFNAVLNTTLVPKRKAEQPEILPAELVKDYNLYFQSSGEIIHKLEVRGNILRVNQFTLAQTIRCDEVKLEILATYGDSCARVMEMQLF